VKLPVLPAETARIIQANRLFRQPKQAILNFIQPSGKFNPDHCRIGYSPLYLYYKGSLSGEHGKNISIKRIEQTGQKIEISGQNAKERHA